MQYLQNLSSHAKILIIILITVTTAILVTQLPMIPQSLVYHDFADHRNFFGIPNFFDVVSNLAFIFAGLSGLFFLGSHESQLSGRNKFLYTVFLSESSSPARDRLTITSRLTMNDYSGIVYQ